MIKKSYSISITQEQHGRFNTIMQENPQDLRQRETFERILRFYEGKSVLPLQDMKPKPAIKIYGEAMTLKTIIDAEKAQKDFIQIGGQKL